MTTVVNPPAPTATAPVVVDALERRNTVGLIALGLAIVGFVLAVFAMTAGLAWMLLVPAIILAVIGLIRPHRTKGSALAGLIIAVVALFLSFVGLRLPAELASATSPLNNSGGFSAGTIFSGGIGGVGAAGSTGATGPSGSDGSSGTSSTTDTGSGTGVSVDATVAGTTVSASVQSVDCGLPLLDVNGLTVSTDVLCAVNVSVLNGTDHVVDVNGGSISLLSNGSPLTVDANAGNTLNAHLGVGETTTGTVYVRVPAGTTSLAGLNVQVG